MKIVARVDADIAIGYGHLVRTLALLDALSGNRVCDCVVATRSDLRLTNVDLFHLPEDVSVGDEGSFIESRSGHIDLLVSDLYMPSEQNVKSLCSADWNTICIDDASTFEFWCDLLVNPNINREFRHRYSQQTKYLWGREALILRKQFIGLEPHMVRERIRNIIVCLGGGDQNRVLMNIVAILRELVVEDISISIIVGHDVQTSEIAKKLPAARRWHILEEMTDMASIMQEADLGIFTGGTLLYEAAAAGLPSLIVSLNSYQKWEAEEAARMGFAVYLGDKTSLSKPLLRTALQACAPKDVRLQMSLSGQECVDGRGADRIADLAANLYRRAS